MNNTQQVQTKAAQVGSADAFFTPIGNTKPYFKAAFEGFAGSGKTHTAALVAIGIHQRIKSKKPVVIFDTEKAAKFLKPLFAEAGIEVLVRESKSLADLKITMQKMSEGLSDLLIVDSISHVWEEYLQAYAKKVGRTRLQFQDWGIIKPTWKAEFSDPFVQGQYHAIFTGRAGYEYDNELNEETGKREIYKSGVKMKVEGETAYEPDILVYMERFEKILGEEKKVWREATIVKDRSTLLDGKTYKNPSYEHFAPAIDALLENPVKRDALVMPEGDTAMLFRTEEDKMQWRRERDKAMEELDGLLTRIDPAATGKGKQLKLDLLDEVFGTTSMTAIGEMRPEEIMDGYKKIGLRAVEMGVAEIITLEDGRKRLIGKSTNGNGNGNGNGDEKSREKVEVKEATKKAVAKKKT
jgi:hypothetical protein